MFRLQQSPNLRIRPLRGNQMKQNEEMTLTTPVTPTEVAPEVSPPATPIPNTPQLTG